MTDIAEKMSELKLSTGKPEILACFRCKEIKEKLIDCPKCKSVSYCGEDCRAKHWETKHRKQCTSMLLARPGSTKYRVEVSPGNQFGKICVASQDIQPGEKLLSEYPLAAIIFHSKEQIEKLSDEELELLFGSRTMLNRMYFPYDSKELISEEELTLAEDGHGHLDMRPLGKLLSALAKNHAYIGRANYFHTTIVGSDQEVGVMGRVKKWLDDQQVDDRTLSMLLGILITNAYQMCPMLSAKGIALGFFPASSMFNHSCNPNADMVYSKGRLFIHSNGLIRANEEITVDYLGGKACISGREERQKVLKLYNNFQCRCPQCLCSQDFVLEAWTVSSCPDKDLKKTILVELKELYGSQKYDKYIRTVCTLWETRHELLISMPYTLLNTAHTLCVATVMTGENQYTNLREQSCKLISYCIARMRDDCGLHTLIDGNRRSFHRIMDSLCAALTIIYCKPLLIMLSGMKEEDARSYVEKHFDENPKEVSHYRKLMGPSLSWLYSRPMKMDVMMPDLAINSMLKYHYLIIEAIMKSQ